MSILVDGSTRVVVQGLTGREGTFHALRCKEYGPQVVGGVTPGKGGTIHEGFPVWNTVEEAVAAAGADCALIFVPPPAAADAIMEAAAAGVPLIVCITEGVPVTDMVRVKAFLSRTPSRLIGPNCPRLTSPAKAKIGIMPAPSSRAARGRPPRRCAPWRRPASPPSRAPRTWAPPWRACSARKPRAMIRAHLRRWRPRPHAQRTESTPRVRPSGAALQLDPSHRSGQSVSPKAPSLVTLVLLERGFPVVGQAVQRFLGGAFVPGDERMHALVHL